MFKKLMDKLLDILGLEIVEQTQIPINQDSLLDSDDLKQQLKEEEVDGCLMWVGCWVLKKLAHLVLCGLILYLLIVKLEVLSIYSELILNPKHDRLFQENLIVKEQYLTSDNESFNQLLYQTVFEEVDERGVIALERVSQLLPKELIDLIKEHNIQINFVNQPISNYKWAKMDGVLGFYSSPMKRIMVQLMNDAQLTEVLLHEIGHFIADKGGRSWGFLYEDIARTKEFKALYKETKDELMTEYIYGYDDIEEYFAQVFMMYFEYPSLLKQRCPQAYEYMSQLIEDIVRRVSDEK